MTHHEGAGAPISLDAFRKERVERHEGHIQQLFNDFFSVTTDLRLVLGENNSLNQLSFSVTESNGTPVHANILTDFVAYVLENRPPELEGHHLRADSLEALPTTITLTKAG